MPHNQRAGALLIIVCDRRLFLPARPHQALFERGVDPLDIGFWRFFFTTLVYWASCWCGAVRARTAGAPLPRLRLILLGMLFAGRRWPLLRLERLPAGTFSVLFYGYPAMVAILEALMGERLSPLAWGALAMTLVGIALTAPDFSAGLTAAICPA